MPNTENINEYDISIDLYKQALEATADGVAITDLNGKIVWINSAYEKLTGYSLDEVKGKNPRILKSGKQDPSYYKKLWETIMRGEVWRGELWNKNKNEKLYLEEQSITPVKDNKANITHFIAIKRDITNQNTLRNRLYMAQRIEAIAKLTAGVAHNFNNKLASILGYTELAIEEIEQYSNDDLDDYLNEISVAGKFSRDLVKQMMSFTQNDINKVKSVDLTTLIKESTKIITSSLPSTVGLLTKLDETVPKTSIDPVQLHQMLLSLVLNSNEAMNSKGVITIGVEEYTAKDDVCSSCHEILQGKYIALYVQDTGKGISVDDMKNIFLPFFTTKEMNGGTGMGLSALHGMLHEQSCHVLVKSIISERTEFRLLLPIDRLEKEAKEENVYHQIVDYERKRNTRVLIVDDDESVANVLAEILRLHEFDVTVELNSKKALINYTKNPLKFDLLITDKDMPHMDGVDFSREVKKLNSNVSIILVTGYSPESIDIDKFGIDMVLTKPLETKELLSCINKLI
jgi:PAS domain S-box-containing protein